MIPKEQKVVLVNAWCDDNKGDGGICEGTLSLLKEKLFEADFSLISMMSGENCYLKSAHRHIIGRFPDLKIVPFPIANLTMKNFVGRYGTGLVWTSQVLESLVKLFIDGFARHPAVGLIRESDLMIYMGGHYLHNRRPYNLFDLLNLYRLLYPAFVAIRRRKPYVLLGQSLGPFTNGLGRFLTKIVLENAQSVYVREERSLKIARELGLKKNNISVAPDLAFALKSCSSERLRHIMEEYNLTEGSFWVVTVRQSPLGPKENSSEITKEFLNEMSVLVRRILMRKYTKRVVLVAHTIGPSGLEDDKIPTRVLASLLKGENISIIEDDLSPEELVGLYGLAEFLIGTRFHSVIFAMVGGTPGIAVSYFGPKSWGIMEKMGLRDFCFNMEKFSANDVLEILHALDIKKMKDDICRKVHDFRLELEDLTNNLSRKMEK